jgi:hypothetical protein
VHPGEQQQERGLESVVGRMGIVGQQAAANGQNHRPMSLH